MANPNHIVFLIARLQESTHRFLTQALRKKGVEGIEPTHGVILRQLHLQGPLSMTDLARLTGRTKPTVTVLIRKLIQNGYVDKQRNQQDKRVFMVRLTPKAENMAQDLESISLALRERLYSGFDDHERQVLSGLVEKALKNF